MQRTAPSTKLPGFSFDIEKVFIDKTSTDIDASSDPVVYINNVLYINDHFV